MKKTILTYISFLLISTSFTQNISKPDTLYYAETQMENVKKMFKKNQSFKTYSLKNKTFLSVGDTLIIGKPATTANANMDLVGTAIRTNIFITILIGKWKSFLMRRPIFLNGFASGIKVSIDNIQLSYVTSKRKTNAFVYFTVHPIKQENSILTITTIEKSLEIGEVINPNGQFKKKEALEKLKEAKELLDLELITQEEYNALKNKLSPIIMKK